MKEQNGGITIADALKEGFKENEGGLLLNKS
jgi:hypothetical protein